jgi:hypothetical protein
MNTDFCEMENSPETNSAETEVFSDSTAVISCPETPTTCSSSENLTVVETIEVKETATPDEDPKTNQNGDDGVPSTVASKPKKAKPRVLKVEQQGIFTIKTLESTNFLNQWFKGFRKSLPSIVRLLKIFWKLSPTRVSILVAVNLLKAVIPSFRVWVTKQFLDQVQRVTYGKPAQWKRMILLILLGVGIKLSNQGMDKLTYRRGKKYANLGINMVESWRLD